MIAVSSDHRARTGTGPVEANPVPVARQTRSMRSIARQPIARQPIVRQLTNRAVPAMTPDESPAEISGQHSC